MAKVSIIIPARAERFLSRTVSDLLTKAAGDIEVIPVLDGAPADPPLPVDPRVKPIINPVSIGMRPCINAGMAAATGEFVCKADAHILFGEGFDEILKADCDSDWIVVPRRYSLDAENWQIDRTTGRPPVDAHYLSCPFDPNPPRSGHHGLQGVWWPKRAREQLDQPITDEMASQGSFYFMTRRHWDRVTPMASIERYGHFIQEFQSISLPTWLGGGRCVVNKKTWLAHLHKGHRYGRGYPLPRSEMEFGWKFCLDYWLNDRWEDRVHDFSWLVEKFNPPGWIPGWQDQHAARMAAGGYFT